MFRAVWAVVILACAVSASAAVAAERVALIVGNAAYQHLPALKTPPNNVAQMDQALEGLGFEVLKATDLSRESFLKLLAELSQRAKGAKVALFYYAGHAVQDGPRHHLIPIEAELSEQFDADKVAINFDLVVGSMAGAGERITFLDAGRDNPLGSGKSTGLEGNDSPAGLFIGYATSPGTRIEEGKEPISPYTAALLQYIEEPGLEIDQLMRKVRDKVIEDTRGKQIPWTRSSLLGEFYLKPRP